MSSFTYIVSYNLISTLAGNLPLLFISAGVVGGIVLLIECVMVVIVCQRRSGKKVEGIQRDLDNRERERGDISY